MIYKLIQIGVILRCLVLPLEFKSAAFPNEIGFYEYDDQISYRLPNDTKPETYHISLRTGISEGQFNYDGFVRINILIVNVTREVTIHSKKLEIKSIRLSNETDSIELLPWRTNSVTDFLIIPTKNAELIPGSRYRLDIGFAGILQERLEASARGFFRESSDPIFENERWIAVTQFESLFARTALPCYDEPGLVANVTIGITHGANYSAVSNMPGSRSENSDGTVTTSFETTPSISPYLIAFAVTDFRYRANAVNSTLPIRVLATASIYNETKLPLVESEKAVKVLEKTLQVPFMLPKLDLIFFRHTRGLASMGNWGLVTIETLFIFQDNEGSENSHLTLLSIVVGELCQQWFANMVSPKWWSQIWVQLSLSTYYEFVVINTIYPEFNYFDNFFDLMKISFKLDVNPEVPPMMQQVEDPQSIAAMFSFINSVKGACVIRMFSNALTEATFSKGIRYYLTNNAFTAVDENDLFTALDEAAKEDGTLDPNLTVNELFSSWSRQAGVPMLIASRNYGNGSITISQERYTEDSFDPLVNATRWWIPYNFATAKSPLFNDTTPRGWLPPHQRTKLIEPSDNDNWTSKEWILFNKQQTGYYRVMYDIQNWQLLIAELNSNKDNSIHPTSRSQLIDDLESFVRTDRLPEDLLIGMVKYLKHETEFVPWMAGSKALLYLNKRFLSTNGYSDFHHLAESIIESAKQRIAARLVQKKAHSVLKTQAILNELACEFGIETCSSVASAKAIGLLNRSLKGANDRRLRAEYLS